ncbi:hypothetical protein M1N10_03415 [Thermodesulfovibrionales bacterium]|nr:hypothetical protein [Thermodesulfovibrionales bacterium]
MTIIIGILIILCGIFLALTKPKLLYFVMVFFAGWYSVFIEIGFAVTAYRLVVLIFLLCSPIYISLRIRKSTIRLPPSVKYLFVFIYYAAVVTVVAQFFAPESHIAGFTRGEGRWIFQIALLLIDVTPAFLPLLFFTRTEDVITTAKVFVVSTTILCIFGWVQSLAFYLYGTVLFPVFREGMLGGVGQLIAVDMFGTTFHRMRSLGGEPKSFAVTVAVAILLLIVSRIVNPKGFRFRNLLLGFFLASLFASLATSGFFVLFMGLALVVIAPFFVKGLELKTAVKSITAIAVIGIIFLGIVIGSGILSPAVIGEVFLERTIRRLGVAVTMEPWNAAAFSFLAAYPQYSLFGVGMGDVHLYAVEQLVQHAMINPALAWLLPYVRDTVFAPSIGFLRIVSELGIIGLVLFLCAFLGPIRSNLKHRQYIHNARSKRLVLGLSLFAVFILVAVLMRYFHVNYAYITLGLVYFLNREIEAVSRRQYG